MKNAPLAQALFRRTLSSIAAIAAVSAIFAVKAMDIVPGEEADSRSAAQLAANQAP